MLVTLGLWMGGASVLALSFESTGAAALLFGVGALLIKLG